MSLNECRLFDLVESVCSVFPPIVIVTYDFVQFYMLNARYKELMSAHLGHRLSGNREIVNDGTDDTRKGSAEYLQHPIDASYCNGNQIANAKSGRVGRYPRLLEFLRLDFQFKTGHP